MSQLALSLIWVLQEIIQQQAQALCVASCLPEMQQSTKYAKLLMSYVAAYQIGCKPLQQQLCQAAASGTSFLAKSCKQKIQKLLTD